jgi:hypothetical protein
MDLEIVFLDLPAVKALNEGSSLDDNCKSLVSLKLDSMSMIIQ